MTPVRQRIQQRTAATLTWSPIDSDGEASTTDPGTVTVGVVDAAGSTVVADGTATVASGASRTLALTAVHTANLDTLTATWKVAGVTVGVTEHDVVGGFYYSLAEVRAVEPTVANPVDYPNAGQVTIRAEVEAFFESCTNVAWMPRFTAVWCDPGASLLTGLFYLRSVRWVREYAADGTYTALTDLSALTPAATGSIARTGGFYGSRCLVGVEHGLSGPPADLKRAAMQYHRVRAQAASSGVPQRAVSLQMVDGGSVQFRSAGNEWRPTGIETIDEVLRRPDYDHRLPGIA